MKNHRWLNLLLVWVPFVALPLSVMAADSPVQGNNNNSSAAPATVKSADGKPEAAASSLDTYKLRPGDFITVTLMGDLRSSHDYLIAPDGTVAPMFLDQPLKLAGLKVNEALQAVTKAYGDAQVFVQPKVALRVNEAMSREQYVNVVGSVLSPHVVAIPVGEPATLVAVITACNGPAAMAAVKAKITRRLPGGQMTVFEADLKAAKKNANQDIQLEDGDTVYLPQGIGGFVW